jgi:hypothetical protein
MVNDSTGEITMMIKFNKAAIDAVWALLDFSGEKIALTPHYLTPDDFYSATFNLADETSRVPGAQNKHINLNAFESKSGRLSATPCTSQLHQLYR